MSQHKGTDIDRMFHVLTISSIVGRAEEASQTIDRMVYYLFEFLPPSLKTEKSGMFRNILYGYFLGIQRWYLVYRSIDDGSLGHVCSSSTG